MRFKHMLDFGLLKIDDDPWSCGKGKQYRHTRTRTVELPVPYLSLPCCSASGEAASGTYARSTARGTNEWDAGRSRPNRRNTMSL